LPSHTPDHTTTMPFNFGAEEREAVRAAEESAALAVAEAETFITQKLQTKTNSAKEGFRALNTNRDGSIAVRELRQALALRFDVQISEMAVRAIVHKYSGGKDSLDFSGFCKLYDARPSTSCSQAMQSATRGGVQRAHTASGTMLVAQDELKETTAQLLQTVAGKFNQHAMSNAALFLKLDTHRSGDISKIELKRGLTMVGINLSASELSAVFERIDTAHSGRISLVELANITNEPAQAAEVQVTEVAEEPAASVEHADHGKRKFEQSNAGRFTIAGVVSPKAPKSVKVAVEEDKENLVLPSSLSLPLGSVQQGESHCGGKATFRKSQSHIVFGASTSPMPMSARGQDRSNGVPTPTRPALAVHSRGENLQSNRSSSQLAASAGLHQLSGAHGKPKAQWTPVKVPNARANMDRNRTTNVFFG